jgi:hypothetical protein
MTNHHNHNLERIWNLLHYTFGIVPIIAGFDKFTNLLTDWSQYLHPALANLFGSPHAFMVVVGIIEIIAGIIVLARPGIGAYIVMIWLICIALQLIFQGRFLDVAVRDLVMSAGAYSLGQLTSVVHPEMQMPKQTVSPQV